MTKYLTPTVRAYLYGVCVALVPLLVLVGWLDVKASPLVLGFVLALLNVPRGDINLTNLDQRGASDVVGYAFALCLLVIALYVLVRLLG